MRHIYFFLGVITGWIYLVAKEVYTDSWIPTYIVIFVAFLVMNIIHSIHSWIKKRTERTSTATEQQDDYPKGVMR